MLDGMEMNVTFLSLTVFYYGMPLGGVALAMESVTNFGRRGQIQGVASLCLSSFLKTKAKTWWCGLGLGMLSHWRRAIPSQVLYLQIFFWRVDWIKGTWGSCRVSVWILLWAKSPRPTGYLWVGRASKLPWRLLTEDPVSLGKLYHFCSQLSQIHRSYGKGEYTFFGIQLVVIITNPFYWEQKLTQKEDMKIS